MTWEKLALRFLQARPMVFWLDSDQYQLKTGEKGQGGFEDIGTEDEAPPLALHDLLSYDEIALSALCSVSVWTRFFNTGGRNNKGVVQPEGTYTPMGFYVGAVGARFERPHVMEHAHMVVTEQQNTPENGYGADAPEGREKSLLKMWANFYGRDCFPTFAEAQEAPEKYAQFGDFFFDVEIYKMRMRMTIETFLLEADEKARINEKRAYCHVVGLGVGAWALEEVTQTTAMLQVYEEIFEEHKFVHIGVVDFSWFNTSCAREIKLPQKSVSAGMTCRFSKRDPAEPVDDGELLVAMYAWDGNALPGNEYWIGQLAASGDPAAACCSTIALLQNPDANPLLRDPKCISIRPRKPVEAA